MASFLDMGGYGGYVWPAFGVTALVLLGLLVASLRLLRARKDTLAAMQGRRPEDARGD